MPDTRASLTDSTTFWWSLAAVVGVGSPAALTAFLVAGQNVAGVLAYGVGMVAFLAVVQGLAGAQSRARWRRWDRELDGRRGRGGPTR